MTSACPGERNSYFPRVATSARQFAGFSGKENGELLALAERSFDVFVTIDKNIRYQQDIASLKIAVLIIRPASNDLDDIRPHVPRALSALKTIKPGQIAEVGILSS